MKKLVIPVIVSALFTLVLTSTSCNDKVCVKCTKVGDTNDTEEFCSSDPNERNNFIVQQTHLDYNCANTQ